MKVTDEMVTRFLSWPLPDNVQPDGVYPAGDYRKKWGHALTGTNLLDATAAKAMLEHVLAAPPAAQPTSDNAAFFRRYVAEASRIQLEQCCLRLRAKLDIFENAAVPVIGEFGVCDTCGRDFPDHWPNGACPQPARIDNGKILGYRIEAKGHPECFHLAESDFCYSDEIAIPLYAKSTQSVTPVEGKVTDEMIERARLALLSEMGTVECCRQTYMDIPDQDAMRAVLEAALGQPVDAQGKV